MRSVLKDIKKIKDQLLMDSRKFVLKVSTSKEESDQFRKDASMDDVLIIMELYNGNTTSITERQEI